MNLTIDENNVSASFKRIADELLLTKALVINEKKFRLTEIEFYFYSDDHQDGYTHFHEYENGHWRFHEQGIDITIKSESGFGGILIRGIRELNSNIFINGPVKAYWEICKYLGDVFIPEKKIGIIDAVPLEFEILELYRQGLNIPSHHAYREFTQFKDASYRFIIDNDVYKMKIPNKEKIARMFPNSKIVDYKIS